MSRSPTEAGVPLRSRLWKCAIGSAVVVTALIGLPGTSSFAGPLHPEEPLGSGRLAVSAVPTDRVHGTGSGTVAGQGAPMADPATPGRVEQLAGQAGYAFDTTGDLSLATTVTVPTLQCSAVPLSERNAQPGLQLSLEIGGQYVMVQSFCAPGGSPGSYQQYSILNVLLSGVPYQSTGYMATVPGRQIQLSETVSAGTLVASIEDPVSQFSQSWTVDGTFTGAFVGALDLSESSAGGVPPYTPVTFGSTLVNGSALGGYLTGNPNLDPAQQNSVFGSTLQDETSEIGTGSSFTITNANLTLPTVSVSTVEVARPASGTATASFTVTLSSASTEPVYLDYATADDGATAGTDYTAVSGTLTFSPGATSQTVPVTILSGPESAGGPLDFLLNITNPSYAYDPPGLAGLGQIDTGPTVLKVTPDVVPLTGGANVTVQGVLFGPAGSADTVKFCDSGCIQAPSATVVSDTSITLIVPNLSSIAPSGATSFTADTVVTDAQSVSSPLGAADQVQVGCDQVVDQTDGAWGYSGCVNQVDSTDAETSQSSQLDGLNISASPSDEVDYSDGGSGGDAVTSTGDSTVSLDLAGKFIPILQGQLDKLLSGPIAFTVPAGTQIAGFRISGSLTLTPDGSQAATGSVKVTLPSVLGGQTGTLTFVTALGQGLSNVSLTVPKADFMKLFSLTDLTASYNMSTGTWSVGATASTGPSQQTTFAGSMTYSGNILKAGSLSVGKISLAGLLDLSALSVTYSSAQVWTGSATITQSTVAGTESGTVSLSVANGVLAKGSIQVKNVPLYGVITLNSFDMTYASGEWTLAVSASVPGGGKGSGSASMTVTNGMISAAKLSLSDVSVLSKVTIKTATLTYSTGGGNETWAGSWDVDLPQAAAAAVDNINGKLTFTNGSFVSGSIGIGANVPLADGVYLTSLGASLALATSTAPMAIGGSASISLGPVISGSTLASLAGGILRAFPLGTVGGSYTFNGNLSILGTTIANGSVVVPDSGATTMTLSAGPQNGSGLSIPVTLGGVNVGTVSVVGGLTGTFSANLFNLSGKVTVTIPGLSPFQAHLVADRTGMAACAGPSGSQHGFEYDWGGDPTYQDSTGCSELGF